MYKRWFAVPINQALTACWVVAVMDAVTTWIALTYLGHQETNPWIASTIAHIGVVPALLVRVMASTVVIAVAGVYFNHRASRTHRATVIIAAVATLNLMVALNNLA